MLCILFYFQSLGFPMASLVAYNRTVAELRYLRGSICPTDSKSELSSSIKFNCDMRAGLVSATILQQLYSYWNLNKYTNNIQKQMQSIL